MKSYFLTDEEDKRILDANGELYKYFYVLGKFSDEDNCLNMDKFKAFVDLSPTYYSKLKKKLLERGIIARWNGKYYFNPVFGVKRDKLSLDLWRIFAEKNSQLYGIKEL